MRKNGIAAAALLVLAAATAHAAKPEWAGHGKGHDRTEVRRDAGRKHFHAEHRSAIHEYYASEFRGGHCPPGLRKKHNGCLPPGKARKWRMGQPLAAGIVTYELPPPLVVQIGLPPPGYRYVRVASDILLIAIGTRMVVDAIRDLGR